MVSLAAKRDIDGALSLAAHTPLLMLSLLFQPHAYRCLFRQLMLRALSPCFTLRFATATCCFLLLRFSYCRFAAARCRYTPCRRQYFVTLVLKTRAIDDMVDGGARYAARRKRL